MLPGNLSTFSPDVIIGVGILAMIAWAALQRYKVIRLKRVITTLGQGICIGIPDPEEASDYMAALDGSDPLQGASDLLLRLHREWRGLQEKIAGSTQIDMQAEAMKDAAPILERYRLFAVFMNRNYKYECEKAQKVHPPLSIFDVAENVLVGSQSDRERALRDYMATTLEQQASNVMQGARIEESIANSRPAFPAEASFR